MKKLNKKGFTIVELVIVIAVIAILAAVMIPTFSGIVAKANKSAALQAAEAIFKSDLVEVNAQPNDTYVLTADTAIADGKTYYTVDDGVYSAVETPSVDDIATYYEKPVATVGAFVVDETNGSYTYEVEIDGYIATFDGNEWTLTEVE